MSSKATKQKAPFLLYEEKGLLSIVLADVSFVDVGSRSEMALGERISGTI